MEDGLPATAQYRNVDHVVDTAELVADLDGPNPNRVHSEQSGVSAFFGAALVVEKPPKAKAVSYSDVLWSAYCTH